MLLARVPIAILFIEEVIEEDVSGSVLASVPIAIPFSDLEIE